MVVCGVCLRCVGFHVGCSSRSASIAALSCVVLDIPQRYTHRQRVLGRSVGVRRQAAHVMHVCVCVECGLACVWLEHTICTCAWCVSVSQVGVLECKSRCRCGCSSKCMCISYFICCARTRSELPLPHGCLSHAFRAVVCSLAKVVVRQGFAPRAIRHARAKIPLTSLARVVRPSHAFKVRAKCGARARLRRSRGPSLRRVSRCVGLPKSEPPLSCVLLGSRIDIAP